MHCATPTDEWPFYWPLICGHVMARGAVIYVAAALCTITTWFTAAIVIFHVTVAKALCLRFRVTVTVMVRVSARARVGPQARLYLTDMVAIRDYETWP